MRIPKGYRNRWRPGQTRISISLSDKVFKRVLEIAKAQNKLFSEVAEDILKCGILCLEESDAQELDNIRKSIADKSGNGSAEELNG